MRIMTQICFIAIFLAYTTPLHAQTLESLSIPDLKKAAQQGNVEAQLKLGEYYLGGLGGSDGDVLVSRDHAEAVKWYRKAAEQGNAEAQLFLGEQYSYAKDGLPRDFNKAVEWFRKAAEQGNVEAQIVLGGVYGGMDPLPTSPGESTKWLRKAAEQGNGLNNALAQEKLGSDMYYDGGHTPQTDAEAVMWLRKAADQGVSNVAQKTLGEAYYAGRGVPQDYKEAYFWLYRAGLTEGKMRGKEGEYIPPFYEEDIATMNFLTKTLPPKSILEIQKRAREWKRTLKENTE